MAIQALKPMLNEDVNTMYFREKVYLAFFISNANEFIELVYPGITPITVVIRRTTPEEQSQRLREADAVCVATTKRRNKPQLSAAFQAIADRRLPEGSTVPPEDTDNLDADGRVRGGYQWEWYPEWLRSYIQEVSDDLARAIQRTTRLARWITDAESPHNPVRSFGAWEWSMDGENWISAPAYLTGRLGLDHGMRITDRLREEIARLVDDQTMSEPLGHELRREAEFQISSNPRSALIITIAAAEAGLKQFISELKPETEWLVENSPSPPVERLLTDYLPLIFRDAGFQGGDLRFPDRLATDVRNGVSLRNKVVHGSVVPLEYDTIKRVLDAVTDVLWILDYFRGFSWATKHLTDETKAEWTPPVAADFTSSPRRGSRHSGGRACRAASTRPIARRTPDP